MPAIPDKDARCREIEGLIASGKGVCESCREIDNFSRTRYDV